MIFKVVSDENQFFFWPVSDYNLSLKVILIVLFYFLN